MFTPVFTQGYPGYYTVGYPGHYPGDYPGERNFTRALPRVTIVIYSYPGGIPDVTLVTCNA